MYLHIKVSFNYGGCASFVSDYDTVMFIFKWLISQISLKIKDYYSSSHYEYLVKVVLMNKIHNEIRDYVYYEKAIDKIKYEKCMAFLIHDTIVGNNSNIHFYN